MRMQYADRTACNVWNSAPLPWCQYPDFIRMVAVDVLGDENEHANGCGRGSGEGKEDGDGARDKPGWRWRVTILFLILTSPSPGLTPSSPSPSMHTLIPIHMPVREDRGSGLFCVKNALPRVVLITTILPFSFSLYLPPPAPFAFLVAHTWIMTQLVLWLAKKACYLASP